MTGQFAIDVRFFRLSEELQPYFTALYLFEIDCGDAAMIHDLLHPEWAAMRFIQYGKSPMAAITPDELGSTSQFVLSGPTSRAIKFALHRSRIWGLGLQPAGWARYVETPASTLADGIFDAASLPGFAPFLTVLREIERAGGDADETAGRINARLLELDCRAPPLPERVLPLQEALRDPEIADVEQLALGLDIGRRSLERLCSRYFGFPPKLLLRRQRFLRSLARFMLAGPDAKAPHKWTTALDVQYYDHAHFVRDFRSFMGMTPTEYAETPHPILDRIMAQRMADQGAAPQTDMPTVLRYGAHGQG
ncbi:helix-turn-helix domain-containing protein [Altererythrobacter sp. KTW20L]|uniref:helix-turn-helix domain-containing protein n=1 Tax=Altererythrobacter sp. KTW20L TaxID=2942210 RepID=UPI0020BE2DE1|nr:helix-turn-helix domain-containing protein [Altererythrobacter sp. KTW20L]MCL6249832.1 helix-turn-helix domain-containing protein [Altererythrobacter sp. KTW20L]